MLAGSLCMLLARAYKVNTALCFACRDWTISLAQGFQLGGFLAALAQGALGGVPIFGAGGPRSYESYHLKRPKPMTRA